MAENHGNKNVARFVKRIGPFFYACFSYIYTCQRSIQKSVLKFLVSMKPQDFIPRLIARRS